MCTWSLIPIHHAANKIRLDMQIEAILKPKKDSRPKKRKKDADEEILDRFADEEVSRLRESMLNAAQDDENANRAKIPATAKLKLLSQVMEVLQKSAVFIEHFHDQILIFSLSGHLLRNLSLTIIFLKV